jgi:single-strand DNA-binding protein
MSDLKMPDLNRVFIAGRLTRDPEVRKAGSANIAKFSLAQTSYYGSGEGKKESTLYVDVDTWNRIADFAAAYLHKGDAVIVEGKLDINEWEAKDGSKRKKHFIRADRVHSLEWMGSTRKASATPRVESEYKVVADDDVPF